MSIEISVKEKMRYQLLNLQEKDLREETDFQKKYSVDLDLANVLVVENLTLDITDKNRVEYAVYLEGIVSTEDALSLLTEYAYFTWYQGDCNGIVIFTDVNQIVEFIFDYFYYDEFCYFGDDY
jgi:hypothetical protein